MEDLLINIHNIDDTHVSDHHNYEDFEYSRPEIFDKNAWSDANTLYNERLNNYYNLSWIKRLFTRKPQKPVLNYYIH